VVLGIGSNPYASLKLMAYSIPFLTLLALSPRRRTQPRSTHRPALGVAIIHVVACCLFAATTASAVYTGLKRTRPATEVRSAARAAAELPKHKVIELAVDDAWDQVWLAYYLRDRRIAIQAPSIVYTGYSASDAAHAQAFGTPADFAIRNAGIGTSVW